VQQYGRYLIREGTRYTEHLVS